MPVFNYYCPSCNRDCEIEAEQLPDESIDCQYCNGTLELTSCTTNIYLIWSSIGLTKIGISCEPRRRVDQVKTNSPVAVELVFAHPCYQFLEEHIHELFDDKRVRGEWFFLNQNDVDEIQRICQRHADENKIQTDEQLVYLPDEY